jgi:molybdate transport system substrate-binding protein
MTIMPSAPGTRVRILRTALRLVIAGCGLLPGVFARSDAATQAPPAPLTVFAAASLTDVLPELAAAWRADGGADVRFSFGATSKLVPQIVEGAPADVLVSADEAWMDRLNEAGRVEPGSRAVVARNALVFVVPADAAKAPASAGELPGTLKTIALAGENVPAGKYAKAALETLKVWTAVEPRVVRAEDVRLTLKWVASGDADGGVVYSTDANADKTVKIAFAFPEETHAPIVYPAAVVKGSARVKDAARFLEFCRGAKARPIFEARGFLPPTP